MSAPLLCFSANLHGLARRLSVCCVFALYFGVLACFLLGFCIFEMPEDSQWTVVKLEHELALRGATTKGKKKGSL